MASKTLTSQIDKNHDLRKQCGICTSFSYFERVSRLQQQSWQLNQCHSTKGLKDCVSKMAKQFIGSRQHDPAEYMGEILNQCSLFKERTLHQSLLTYTCINCREESPRADERNMLIQPLWKANKFLTLSEILENNVISRCKKIVILVGLTYIMKQKRRFCCFHQY